MSTEDWIDKIWEKPQMRFLTYCVVTTKITYNGKLTNWHIGLRLN